MYFSGANVGSDLPRLKTKNLNSALPGYLSRDDLLREIGSCFAQWGAAAALEFKCVDDEAQADVAISFANKTKDNIFLFDGAGGALAHATKDFIQFDIAERWVLQGGAGGLGTFFILPVCLHEIGHILGLTHSKALDDVMAPFYVKEKLSLTEGDISRIQKMYN